MSTTPKNSDIHLDPLYVIFEQHLYNFKDEEVDRNTFITGVVQEYFSYLRRQKIAIPRNMELAIMEELGAQVHTMLVKKIYGCLSIKEYQKKKINKTMRSRAGKRYAKLDQTPYGTRKTGTR